jgi:hypothetical protein
MGSGSARLTSTDRAIVDQHHSPSGARQEISGRHSSNARSNDADVGAQIMGKRLELWDFGRAHPDGGRVT